MNQYTTCTASVVVNISAYSHYGMSQWAQLVASMSDVVLGGVVMVVGSNLARGKKFTAYIGSFDSLYPSVYIYNQPSYFQYFLSCSVSLKETSHRDVRA